MLTAWDLLLAALIALGLPLRALHSMRTLKAADPSGLAALRPRLWTRAMLTQWLLCACVVALWVSGHREWHALGLVLRPSWGLTGVLLGLFAVVSIVVRQRGRAFEDPEIRARIRERLRGVERLMPRRGEPFLPFAALAVTAGVCEEFLFRGFLFWVFLHFLPFWGAAAAQALCFGLGHAYQGRKGVLLTGAAGAFLTLIVTLTGSLFPAMLIHALMDLHAGDMGRRAFDTQGGKASSA